jgi:hypothetical protein
VNKSFGRVLCELSPAAALSIERESGAFAAFAAIDLLTNQLLRRSVHGEKVATIIRGESFDQFNLLVCEADRQFLGQNFRLSEQQGRGAWFLPEQTSLHVGIVNLAHHFRRYSRFSGSVARDEVAKVDFRRSAEALYCWGILEPLMDLVYRPLTLRSASAIVGREKQIELWSEVETDYSSLNLHVRDALAVFKFGGGWSKLRAPEQIRAKEKLFQALAASLRDDTASLHRISTIQRLLNRYYARSKRGAAPKMRQVLTRPFQRTISAYFGGDWLSFVRYLGESPHAEERIARALPEPRLYVTAKESAAALAATHAMAPVEIEKILQAFWGGEHAESPVQRRVAALRLYWSHFDHVHARQASRDQPLWGFVPENQTLELNEANKAQSGPTWYVPGSYRRLLPSDLLKQIDELWSGLFLPSRPDAIVTMPSPHAMMAETFGPALRFWHGAALTAWFVSEGPYSRTDVAGLAKYHRRDLSQLEALNCPINMSLFDELIAAEKKLGKPTPVTAPGSEHQSTAGAITLKISMTIGSRRDGFVRLRDILTAYRRDWAQRFLEAYLRALWEGEIRGTAREYNRLFEIRGKIPTIKQCAKFAAATTNHWFGGDISALFTAFGEKSPVAPVRVRFLPRDVQGFMWRVFAALGGTSTSFSDLETLDPVARSAQWNAHLSRKRLAEYSPRYVQLCEGSGQAPSLKEFGKTMFQQAAGVLATDLEEAWCKYSEIVEKTLQETAIV